MLDKEWVLIWLGIGVLFVRSFVEGFEDDKEMWPDFVMFEKWRVGKDRWQEYFESAMRCP